MKWLSFGFEYAHEMVGGTQFYVHRLNVALRRRGVDAIGAYFTRTSGAGNLDGVPLMALPMPPLPASRMESWECPPHSVGDFERLLANVRPDVVHFHSTLTVHPPEFFESARRAGARTLWTFHAPGQTCLQTALLRNGDTPCDGFIDPNRCARCGLVWLGLPSPVAALFAAGDWSALAPLVPPRLRHPFERHHGVARFLARLKQACESLDHWVTHARWVDDLLQRNHLGGLPALALPLPPPMTTEAAPDSTPWEGLPQGLRLLFAGRLLDIKGPQLILAAMKGPLRGADVSLVLLAPTFGTPFESQVRDLVAAEPRARLLPARDPVSTFAAMASADAVIVPSTWKETGPYTVVEAQCSGAPVIGANLAGVAERLEHDAGSRLFQSADVNELGRAIESFRGRRKSETERQQRAHHFRATYAQSFDAALTAVLERLRP